MQAGQDRHLFMTESLVKLLWDYPKSVPTSRIKFCLHQRLALHRYFPLLPRPITSCEEAGKGSIHFDCTGRLLRLLLFPAKLRPMPSERSRLEIQ